MSNENIRIFETHEAVEDMKECIKKRIIVHCKQIEQNFQVRSLEGNYKNGKAGDYLMRGIEGELYICDRSIFEQSYDILPIRLINGTNSR
jgi:hypothetical protein